MQKRRTQKERSATTRKVLLDAAIDCLFHRGYGATSTTLVAEMAGVSRGAMLHQFPSKADLMAYVVKAVWEADLALYQEMMSAITNPQERMVAYPAAAWKVMSRPAGIAVMEIFLGSRSDPALAEKLLPVQAEINEAARATLARELNHPPSIARMQLIIGAVRGLSINEVIDPDGGDASAAIKLLQDLIRAGLSTGLLS